MVYAIYVENITDKLDEERYLIYNRCLIIGVEYSADKRK